MKIINLKEIDSTHKFLKEYIQSNGYLEPLCISADLQTSGIGSRGNLWIGKEGNLFFSFVLKKENLPNDLPIQSSSIYFSYILKKVLKSYGSKLWLKWPNDFYVENKKIGGTITNVSGELLYCGIGLNLLWVEEDFGKLDIIINKEKLLEDYFLLLSEKVLWKEIFREFKIEFQLSLEFFATINNIKQPLKEALLNKDGSITVNNEKVFSLR